MSVPANSSETTPVANPAREDALEALECVELLAWLASYATTVGGKALMQSLIQEQGSEVVELRRLAGADAMQALAAEEAPSLARCADMVRLLTVARQGKLDGLEFLAIAETLDRLQDLRLWASRHPQYAQLCAIIEAMPSLQPLRERIRQVLDARGQVQDEAHPDLPALRAQIRQLTKGRNQKLEAIAESMFQRGLLRQRQPVKRGDRLLLAVRATSLHRQSGVIHDRSQSGDTLFVEPGAVLELSNRIAEAEFREQRLVDQVLSALCVEVLRAEGPLQEVEQGLSRIDCALAAARWSHEVGARYPEVEAEAPALRLFAARHPLLVRQLGSAVVPLQLQLGQSFDLLVVTGPNTGGKTLVLKTVGLLVWMSQQGLPVTVAAGTVIPPLQAVLADIGDAQSLQSSLSTFSGHLQRIQRILQAAGPGVLVLLDELGTGTDPEEGAALGQAVLETLQDRGAWVLASTHLGSLKVFSLNRPRAENASMEFDPLSLEPKYRLLVGVPGASHAVEVAERLGLATELLERARQLVVRGDGTEQLLADVGRVRREAEILREAAGVEEQRVLQRARQLAMEESASQQRQRLREQESETAFRSLVRRLQDLFQRLQGELLPRLARGERAQLEAFLQAGQKLLDEDPLNQRWRTFVRSLKKGSVVYVPQFQERLPVLKVDRKRGRVTVRHGDLEIALPFQELTWVIPPAREEVEKDSHRR